MPAMTTPNLSRRIVAFVRDRQNTALPEPVSDQATLHIADAFGIAYSASHTAIGGKIIAGLGGIAGSGGSRLIGSVRRAEAALAAFANGSLIHALDFDDIHDAARIHPTAVTLASALAVAEDATPYPVLVQAVAISNELICRLGMMWQAKGSGPGADWFLTQVFGYLAGAVAAGLVLDLDDDDLVSAIGLAYMQAAGGKEAGFGTGSTARAIYPGFAAMGGVHAALLARAGIIGPQTALDGAANLFRLYLGQDPSEAQLEVLLRPTGWVWQDTAIKPFPSCRISQPYIAAAQALRPKLNGAQPTNIRISVNTSAEKLCLPLAERMQPQTLQDAKYSIPFMVAFAILHEKVDLQTLTDDALNRPEILTLTQRVEIINDLPDGPGNPPARLWIKTANGDFASPEPIVLAIAPAEVRRKFLACCGSVSSPPSSSAAALTLWEALRLPQGNLGEIWQQIAALTAPGFPSIGATAHS